MNSSAELITFLDLATLKRMSIIELSELCEL
jgi:hypothetical protein